MKGLAQAAKQEIPQENDREELSDEENMDVEIAEALGLKMINSPEGDEVIAGAVNGEGDPAAKLGVFFAELIDKIQTKMENTPTPLSPRIWLSHNGVLDMWVEDLAEDGLIPIEIGPTIKEEVLNILKLQEQSVKSGPPPMEQPGAPPPPMPQGVM